MKQKLYNQLLVAFSFLILFSATGHAQGTQFTYQGQLIDNASLANGTYDLSFSLFNSASGGSELAPPVTNLGVAINNGQYTVTLDFGTQVFTGTNCWLELGVRTNGTTAFHILSPRQALLPTPYAVFAENAGVANRAASVDASDISGLISRTQLQANLVTNGQSGIVLQGTFSGYFLGDGTGISNLNASQFVGGKLLDSRLSTNVPLLACSNIFTGSDEFDGPLMATNSSNVVGGIFVGTIASSVGITNFSGVFGGDVTGTQGATVVSSVGGQSAANVAAGTIAANAATPANTANTIVERDTSGNFSAGTITAAGFIGDGSGLTNLNASLLATGTVADALLSTNVPLLNASNLFSGSNAFTGPFVATNSSNQFGGIFLGTLGTSVAITNFTGTFNGDVTGSQNATVVSSVGGQNAAAVASGAVAANGATSTNIANAIVRRDASGNFSANSITASFVGDGSALSNLNASQITNGTLADARLSTNVPFLNSSNVFTGNAGFSGLLIATNSSNQFGGIFLGTLGASVAITNFAGTFNGDVTGSQNATVVSSVGGQSAATVASGAVTANAATSTNIANAIVRRDASGNFSANSITASFVGDGSALSNLNASQITNGTLADVRLSTNVPFLNASNAFTGLLVATNSSNQFGGTFLGTLGAAVAITNFSGTFNGDVTGSQNATVVSSVGGQTATTVASGAVAANGATSTNIANAIVRRDASGNFSANSITASFVGDGSALSNLNASQITNGTLADGRLSTNVPLLNASNAFLGNAGFTGVLIATNGSNQIGGIFTGVLGTSVAVTNFTGTFNGDVTGSQNATVVSSVGGQNAVSVANGVAAANGATNAAVGNTLVKRDSSGNFSANVITVASIVGSGSNLLNLNASQLSSGTVPLAQLSTNLQILSISNATNLTNIPASQLTGPIPSNLLTSVPAANLIGSIPSTLLISVAATNLTGTLSNAVLPFNLQVLNSNNGVNLTNISSTALPSALQTLNSGNGGALNNLSAAQLTGTVPTNVLTILPAVNLTGIVALANLPGSLLTTNITNATVINNTTLTVTNPAGYVQLGGTNYVHAHGTNGADILLDTNGNITATGTLTGGTVIANGSATNIFSGPVVFSNHFGASGLTPTLHLATGSGASLSTGATSQLGAGASDYGGIITITNGSALGGLGGPLFTNAFAKAFSNPPAVQLCPRNGNAAVDYGYTLYVTSTTTNFVVACAASLNIPVGSEVYMFNYTVTGQ